MISSTTDAKEASLPSTNELTLRYFELAIPCSCKDFQQLKFVDCRLLYLQRREELEHPSPVVNFFGGHPCHSHINYRALRQNPKVEHGAQE